MAFRAFYALPVDNFTTSTGQSTNAVHGFVSMFLSLLDSERPTHVAVAFDLPGGTFRTEEYAEYKGTRDETPQPFLGQVELIQEVLEAMGVTALTAPGYEADDILATLATSAQAEGMEVLICSGDRDSFQTVTERCTVLYPVKGVSTLRRMTPQEVEERYGVTPERYPHLAALVGETSDNLPGVPGVGPKTAAKWINLYDGLDGVIAHADQIKGKAGQSLRDHLDDVVRNRRLNRLLTDLDLGIEPRTDLRLTGADRAGLARVFETLEFRTLHQRALRILSFTDTSDHAEPSDADEASALNALSDLEIVSLGHDLAEGRLAEWLEAGSPAAEGDCPRPLGVDVVGVLKPVEGDAALVSLSDGSRAVAIDLTEILPEDETVLARLLADVERPKLVADAKGSWHALSARGLTLDGVIADPSLAGYLCRPEQRSYDVETLTQRWLGIDLAAANQVDLQRTGTALGQESLALLEGGADEQELLGRVAVLAQDAAGDLASADRGLGLGLLGDRHDLAVGVLALDDLVDQGGRRHARARHQLGAHAVGIHGGGTQGGDRVLVEVGGHRDLRGGGTHRVELSAHLEGLGDQVARVQAHRAQLAARSARGLDRVDDALPDVVGIHEQRRASAQLGDLGIEGIALSVMQERERVGGRADATDPIALGRLEVGGTLEATDDGGARCGDCGTLVGAARTHVHAGATVGRDCHARGCRSHRAVVVENRQEQRRQERAVRESALNGEQGRT